MSKYKPTGVMKPLPVLAKNAIDKLDTIVKDARVYEYGAGGSTLWLAQRARHVISAEDDPAWYKVVLAALAKYELQAEVNLMSVTELPKSIYRRGKFDVVLVDCHTQEARYKAIEIGARYVKDGGWLVADDYNFPLVKKGVDELKKQGWAVTMIAGVKMHPVRRVRVNAYTAFCQKPEDE